MRKNNKGFSLVIAMGLVILINLLAIGILEYVVPFSRNTKGIENSVSSYYQANSGIENALFDTKDMLGSEPSDLLNGSASVDYSYTVVATGTTLPPPGNGNSEYDSDWNKISSGNPIQIEVGNDYVDFSNIEFAFRVPDLNGPSSTSNQILSGSTILPIINWQLSAQNDTLNSDGSYITESNDICSSNEDFTDCDINFALKNGVKLDDNTSDILTFYSDSDNCNIAGKSCILKLSIINKLELTDGTSVPYLEWKIVSTNSIPLRYSVISSEGKSYGFKKSLEVRVPQKTVSEAFDFTVFQ